MQLIIQNKLMTLRGGSTIQDVNGRPVFKVRGKMFSITRKKFICDLDGNCLYIVRNKYFKLLTHKAFILDQNKEKVAYVKSRFWSFGKNKFIIENMEEDEIRVDGSILQWNYSVIKNEVEVATIRRNLAMFTDRFTLTADDNENIAFLVALVIAIDNITDKQAKS